MIRKLGIGIGTAMVLLFVLEGAAWLLLSYPWAPGRLAVSWCLAAERFTADWPEGSTGPHGVLWP